MIVRTLAVLGGGSAYAPGLLQALLAHAAELSLVEVRLFDIAAERLALVARLARGMARVAGSPFTVEATDDLRAAVAGADAVLNSTRPGGFASRRIDETLPLEFGIPGQETVGPGGFFYALRSVPVALHVAATMRAAAPGAVLLNYTNPTNLVTQALADAGTVPVIGLCDQADEDLQALAGALGRPGAAWTFGCDGLNHATWYADVAFDGAPFGGPAAAGALAPPEWFDEEHRVRFAISGALARRHPGWWPNSYLAYYESPDELVACARRTGPRTDAIVARLPEYYAHFAAEAARERPQLRLHRGTAGFGDLAVRVLRALGAERPREIVLNVPNRGASPRFADDTVVEVPVAVGRDGLERRPATAFPDAFAARAGRLEAYQRAAARAAAGRDETAAVDALSCNPLVPSRAVAAALFERAKTAYGEEVPLFR